MRRAKKSPAWNDKLRVSSEILRALAHPLRLKMLDIIDKNRSINVNKIYEKLGLEQSITSQHLRTLRRMGIVHTLRDGKFIFYTIDYRKVEDAIRAVGTFASFAEDIDVFDKGSNLDDEFDLDD